MRKFTGKPLVLALLAALACLVGSRADAQDISLNPTYGSVKLKAGFLPDPFTKNVVSGGNIDTNLGGVGASVANAPDFKLYYEAGNFPLTIHVKSESDTTLLINTPDGKWVANDDGGGFPNPLIKWDKPMSGRYDIYVGSFKKGENKPATLYITELAPKTGGGNAGANEPDISLPPTYGQATLKAGFLPDPYVKNVVAGGNIRTNLGGVGANVAKAPDFKLNYTKGNFALTFHVESQADTTLLINQPNGTWVANDDTNGLNPQIKFAQPMSGRYDVYVGTFGAQTAPAVLKITELK